MTQPTNNEDDMQFDRFFALTFDIVGTLIDYRSGALSWMRKRLSADGCQVDDTAILEAFHAAEEAEHRAHPGTPFTRTLPAIWQRVAQAFGVEPDPEQGEAFMRSIPAWPAFADSKPSLAWLGERYLLAGITNADRWAAHRMAETLGEPFSFIVTAEDAGITKPHTRPFLAAYEALEKRAVSRDAVLHVAQGQRSDLPPTWALGLPVVWINRQGETRGDSSPAIEVPDMTSLVKRIALQLRQATT